MPHKLPTINAEELLSCPLPPTRFVIDQLLPQGLHILAGATKIGKSWLALALCLCVAKGEPLWSFAAQKCGVLYLCLEDSYQRIRCRLLDLTEDAPDTLYFSVLSAQLHNGLEQQIEQFLSEHPDTGLVVIDTLQRVRGSGDNGNPYANDYHDIGTLKALADKHHIAILLIHHVRKLRSDDPMDMISGTNGISGATDTNFVLMKTSRSENTATLYCTGRDIVYRELRLEFDSETHLWNLLSDDSPQTAQPDARLLSLLSELLRQQPAISVPAATLLKLIDPDGAEGLTPNLLSRRIRKTLICWAKTASWCPSVRATESDLSVFGGPIGTQISLPKTSSLSSLRKVPIDDNCSDFSQRAKTDFHYEKLRFQSKNGRGTEKFPAPPHLAPVARRVAACGPVCGLAGRR